MNYKDKMINELRDKVDNHYPEINSRLKIEFRDLQEQAVLYQREIAYLQFVKTKNECFADKYKEMQFKANLENSALREMVTVQKKRLKEFEVQESHYNSN
jgi:hypothetical protein